MAPESTDPKWIDLADGIDLGYVTDFRRLLFAIGETMPEGAVLVLEGGIIASDVRRFVEVRQPAVRHETRPNTIWPAPLFLHLPLEGRNLADLRSLAEEHDDPEVADHLIVIRDGEALLWAHDAGYGHVRVSESLDPAAVDRLRELLADVTRRDDA